jgi:hypothetical protein
MITASTRFKLAVPAALAWGAIIIFVLPALGHESAVDECLIATAAVLNLLGLWFIRLEDHSAKELGTRLAGTKP